MEITFVTGSEKKVKEVRAILGDSFHVKWLDIDLPELQGDPLHIAREKCIYASHKVDGPIITEDTCLCLNALGGLPGPYIKWFLDKIGNAGVSNLLAGFEDKTAYGMCITAYCKSAGDEPVLLVGKKDGEIVFPRGSGTFGWDPIFQPVGYDKTYAELDVEIKCLTSPRAESLYKLKQLL